MPCETPVRAYQRADGGALKFNPPDTNKGGYTYNALDIPCGVCILCRQEQARQWAVRIVHEAQSWKESSFITLTYSDENLPKHGSLRYQDLVRFWKRLRKQIGSIRYYAVGEYGDQTLRPHYHACLFGQAFTEGRIITREKPTRLWTTPTLNEMWGLGNVQVGSLTFETARYTASYVLKKLTSKKQYVRVDEETGELVKLEQPRPFMSKNLGKAWWVNYQAHTTAHDYVVISAKKQKPPKAYDRWLGEMDKQKLDEIKKNRKARAKEKPETREKRAARARVAHAHAKRKSKSL